MQKQVVGGDVVFPLGEAKSLLKFYSEYSANAPDDLYVDFILSSPAGGEGGVAIIHVCYSGPEDNAENVLAPVRKAGNVLNDGIKTIDYTAIQQSWDNSDPRNEGQYMKSGFVTKIDDKLVDALIDGLESDSDRSAMIFFQHAGGVIGRVPTDATAFAHRYTEYNMFISVAWPLDLESRPHIEYIRRHWSKIAPSTYGYYTNDVSDEPQSKVHANYQGNFERLLVVKKRYDPDNLFRLNANIDPNA